MRSITEARNAPAAGRDSNGGKNMPLREGIFEYETEIDLFENKSDTQCAVVTGSTQERRFMEVPETLGGLPVRKIAPHALSEKKDLRMISLPRSLRSVGAFALHNCPLLEEISLHDGIRDFHNGVFRQDHRLRRIRLKIHENNYTVMRDILSDTDARLRFCLELDNTETRLLFPGYDYSFNENTMARTIQFSILGSGMFYRECVRRRGINWREYDRLFPRVIPDDAHAAAEIAADRLLYPYDLAPVHARAYEEFLRENAPDVLLQFVQDIAGNHTGSGEEEAYARLRLMADRGLICGEAADPALKAATEQHLTEVCSIIMAGRETTMREGTLLSRHQSSGAFALPGEEGNAPSTGKENDSSSGEDNVPSAGEGKIPSTGEGNAPSAGKENVSSSGEVNVPSAEEKRQEDPQERTPSSAEEKPELSKSFPGGLSGGSLLSLDEW